MVPASDDATLVDRRVSAEEAAELQARAAALPAVEMSPAEAADLELIADGAYSPISGFLAQADYDAVVEHAALASGAAWTLPITLALSEPRAAEVREGQQVALRDGQGRLRGVLTVEDVFRRDVEREAAEVYRTSDDAHPGVRALRAAGDVVVGGSIRALPAEADALALTPAQTRKAIAERDWTTVVGFQTRNPVHRAHEYLTKVALEQVDGLLLHPLVGVTKDDDIPAPVRMRCYDVLLRNYYPANRVLLATFPAAMRYAGPREAVYHGLVRRNYGCTHFIIGRDAAGVGSYYGTYDAQLLYDELGGAERLGFTAFKFEHTFWCNACESMASARTCPHDRDQHVMLSGTAVRAMLSEGGTVPHTFTRPEVAEVLREAYSRPGGSSGA
ncbi:MAG TPA: sulfate adenylyltransferase [Candidatus Dormibacteraeota bacterium]|nr:sulfate adenylyltransferase [Candidatus Dormibacteraeota bacterium]